MTHREPVRGASQILLRGLDLADRVTGRLRRRIQASTPAPATDEAPADGKYGRHWSSTDESEARLKIAAHEDSGVFEISGESHAEILRPYLTPSSVVMDLGCGIGRVTRYVAPLCKSVWAVDASSQMLELATKRLADLGNVRFARCHDVSVPDIPTGSVDVIFSFFVLQHLERDDAFLMIKELRRVIKADGVVLLNFPNILTDGYLESFVTDATTVGTSNPVRTRVYSPQEVERILPAAGFGAEVKSENEIWAICRPI